MGEDEELVEFARQYYDQQLIVKALQAKQAEVDLEPAEGRETFARLIIEQKKLAKLARKVTPYHERGSLGAALGLLQPSLLSSVLRGPGERIG